MTDLEPNQGSVPLLTETSPSETEGNDANNTTVPFPRKNSGENSVPEPTSSTAAPVENASEASSRRPVTRSLSGRPGPAKRSAMNSLDHSADENEEQEVPPTKKQKTARRSTRKSNSAATASATSTGTASTDVPMDDSTSQSLPVPAPEQSTSTVSELTDVDPDTSVSTNAPATPLIATRIGTKRAMRATLPTPVPNLTKKSRGRRVPVRVVTTTGAEIITQPVPGPAGTFAAETGSGPSGNTKDKRSYVCSVEGCGKCFFRGEHLKRHIRSIHTHEKPFKCTYPECDKNFNRHDNLLQHLKVHKQAQATAAMTANGGPVVLLPNGNGNGGKLPKSTKKASSSSKGKSKSESGSKSTSAKSKGKGKRSSGSGRGRGKRKRRAASSDDDDEDDDDEIQDEGQDSDQVGSEDASGSDSGSDNDNDEEEDAVATAEAEASAVNNLLSLRSRSRSSAALKGAPTLITPLHHTLTSSYAPTFSTLSSATLGTLGGTLGSLGGSGSVSSPSSSSSTSTLVAVGSASGWGYPTGSSSSSFLGSKPSFISAFAPAFSFTTTTGTIGTFHPDQHYHPHSFIQSQGPGGGAGGPFSLSKAAYPSSTSSTSSPGPGPGPGQSSLPTGQMSYQPHQQNHHQMHGGPNGLGYHMMNMNQSGAGAGNGNGVGGETSFQSQLHALNGMNMNGSGETSFQSNMALSSLRSTSMGTTMRSTGAGAGAGAGAGTGVSMNVEDVNGNGNTMAYGNVNGTGKQVVNVGGDVRDVHGGVPVSVSVAVPPFRGGPGAAAGMDMEGMTTNAAQLQSQTQADVANASIDTNQNANGIDINTTSSTSPALSQPQPDGVKTAEPVDVDVTRGEGREEVFVEHSQSGPQSQFLTPSTSAPVSISTAVDHVGADENGNVTVHGKEIQITPNSVLSSGEGNSSSGPELGLSSAGMFPILQNENGNKTGNGNVDSVILEMANNTSGNGDGKANGSVVSNGIDVTSGSVSSSF